MNAAAAAVCAQSESLATLQSGWDGYHAAPIEPEIIASALECVRALPEPLIGAPRAVPTSRGGLQLEWSSPGSPRALEFEWERPGYVHYLTTNSATGRWIEDEVSATDLDTLIALLREHHGP